MPIHKNETHEIEFTVTGFEGWILFKDLKDFVSTLEAHGFVDSDKIDVFGASINQRAHLTTKRSTEFDKMNAMDRTVYDMENR